MWIDHTRQLREEIFSWLSRATTGRGAQKIEELSAAIASSIGMTRTENQDCAVAVHHSGGSTTPTFAAFLLCDGIGGLRDGGVCARLASATFIASLLGRKFEKASQRLIRSASAANEELFDRYRENGGTTLSCVLIQQMHDIAGLSVGDSRIYELTSDRLLQLSDDDTLANQIKQIRPNDREIANPAFGKQLTQFIGMGADVQFRPLNIQIGSNGKAGILLTTDGVHGINTDTFKEVVIAAPEPVEVVKRLATLARWGRSTDNATAICVGADFRIPPTGQTASERLLIWDSYSQLNILLNTKLWGKERRSTKGTTFKRNKYSKKRHRTDDADLQKQGTLTSEQAAADLRSQSTTADTGQHKPTRNQPLQLEIIERNDDQPAD